MVVTWVVQLLQVYAALGIVFGILFVRRGAHRIDPVAREGTWGFRTLIFPGAAALWPLLLLRWVAAVRRPTKEVAEETEGANP